MFILLEPGMKIEPGDEIYINEEWATSKFFTGNEYYKYDHFPMRRKITHIEELFAAYNKNQEDV